MMCSATPSVGEQLARRGARRPRGVVPRGRVPAIGRTVTRAVLDPHQTSGEAPTSVAVAEREEEHVRRRVDACAGSGRRRTGRPRRGSVEALRQHDLDDVAGADVLLGAAHGRLVARRGESRARARWRRSAGRVRRQCAAHALLRASSRLGLVVRRTARGLWRRLSNTATSSGSTNSASGTVRGPRARRAARRRARCRSRGSRRRRRRSAGLRGRGTEPVLARGPGAGPGAGPCRHGSCCAAFVRPSSTPPAIVDAPRA